MKIFFIFAPFCCFALGAAEDVFLSWTKTPYTHPNIPYIAQAGYRCGKNAVVDPQAPRFTIESQGAIPDDGKPDDLAFTTTLTKAEKALKDGAQQVIIVVGPGKFEFERILFLGQSGLVFQGAGSEKTILHFRQPLNWTLMGVESNENRWAFRGGNIWVEADPDPAEKSEVLASVSATLAAGTKILPLKTEELKKFKTLIGQPIHLRYFVDDAWMIEVYGHAQSAQSIDWSDMDTETFNRFVAWDWPNRVVAVHDNGLEIEQPLRVSIKPQWKVTIAQKTGEFREVQIRNLAIEIPTHPQKPHLKEAGYNGIFFRHARDCFVEDVKTINADCGLVLESTSHVTAQQLHFSASSTNSAHHCISLRTQSHENLMRGITNTIPVRHGFGTQDLSAGNVFSRGILDFGLFDCHRNMSFDNVRTEISIVPTGGGGGAFGPLCGRRVVNWNMKIILPSEGRWKSLGLLTNPGLYPMGALVGVCSPKYQDDPMVGMYALPPGPKGCLVESKGQVPTPINLHDAQVEWIQKQK